ncbi:methyl-accepting chemotaxis protein [Cohnella endophytica]|uniref:Methyl-accepting chemotaxis protein n=1 Tax=Cohnella endophytica TaxID=2419778 RepID=A0A494XL59_9BACL|nr:methyl-accepting chemotaxis protein [Cohnella endophytica]RKP48794.1 methyl-accepting chemotaxis protein [Cohnella endophytica]
MKWFYNLQTSTKLISSFMLIAVIMTFVGVYGMNNLGKMNGSLNDMYDNQLVAIQSLQQAQIGFNDMRVSLRKLYMSEDEQVIAKTKESYKQQMTIIEQSIKNFRQTKLSDSSAEMIQPFDESWSEYMQTYESAVKLKDAGQLEEMVKVIDNEYQTITNKIKDLLTKLIQNNLGEAENSRDAGAKLYSSSRNVTLIVLVVAVILSVLLGYVISRIIANPLRRVVELVKKVSEGDLTQTVNIQTKDEIGNLASSVDAMVRNLRRIVGDILANSESLAAASQQISASSEEIATGNSNQADAAQTISELFNELSSAIHSVARNTELASELSDSTVRVAKDGEEVIRSSMESMNEVSGKMSRLEDDSQKIGDIIEVIEDIADQTNLLALNAAIEAARAGEQGRGFAVVADEVRKLAERSSEATKQITGIIKGMQENTKQSVAAVHESATFSRKTGESFKQIAEMVNDAGNKVTEIAAASEEQAAQASTVQEAVESISATTEEAAAASQETAATAQSLAVLAADLQRAVSLFTIGNS